MGWGPEGLWDGVDLGGKNWEGKEGMGWMAAGVNSFEDALSSGLPPSIYPVLTASWEMKRGQKPMSCKYVWRITALPGRIVFWGWLWCLWGTWQPRAAVPVGAPWAGRSTWMRQAWPFSGFCLRGAMTKWPESLWSSNRSLVPWRRGAEHLGSCANQMAPVPQVRASGSYCVS